MYDFTNADFETKRMVGELEKGNQIFCEAGGPYGFWKVTYSKGVPPAKLRGTYTTFDQANRAVQNYLAKRKVLKDLEAPKSEQSATRQEATT